jgi:hypothetical protein
MTLIIRDREVGGSSPLKPKTMPFVIYLIIFHAAWATWVLIGYPRLKYVGEQTLAYALINLTIRGLVWVLPVLSICVG